MKSKELVRRILEADPSGEIECCIGNADIEGPSVEPAYWDGPLQVFKFNEKGYPVSAKRVRSGEKMVLSPLYISNFIGEYDGFTVEYQSDEDRARYEYSDKESARFHNQIEADVDKGSFVDFVFRKIQSVKPVPMGWVQVIKMAAEKFYDENSLSPENPLITMREGRSYADCRDEYLDEHVTAEWDKYSRINIAFK